MLGGNDDGVDAGGLAVDVFDRDLALAVGTEVLGFSAAARFAEPAREPMRQHDRQRHQLRRLVAGIAEHQALIAGAAGVHAHGDVAGLGVHEVVKLAGLAIEADGGIGVADVGDGLARDGLIVDCGGSRDFAGDHAAVGGHQRFTGHAAHGVLGESGVQHRIADLIADFVRVAFGDGLGSENVTACVGQLSPPLLFGVPQGCQEAQRLRRAGGRKPAGVRLSCQFTEDGHIWSNYAS